MTFLGVVSTYSRGRKTFFSSIFVFSVWVGWSFWVCCSSGVLPGFGGKVNRLFLPFLAKAWRFREERFLFCFVHVLRCRCRCGRRLCPVGLLSPGILISGLQQLRSDDGSETIITIIVFSVLE
jgi:hypothetical protein